MKQVFGEKIFLICLHSLKTKPFVHVWGQKSWSSVINNRKSLIRSEWNSLQLIIFKVKHTWNSFFARQEMQEIEFLSNQIKSNQTITMKTFGVVREENKKSTKRTKMPKIRLILSINCHRYFDTNHFIKSNKFYLKSKYL
jgi:hypothetical protein